MIRCLLGALGLAILGLAPTAGPAVTRVLLVGNSLTTANDLAGMVQALGQTAHRRVECRVVAFNDFSLEDHWARGAAQQAIAEGGWAFVVLQQGPSALPASEVLLRDYVGRYAALIKRVGARPALYMVWPAAARPGDFDGVHRSYAAAATDVGGLFLPVGDAWREAWRRDPSAALYGPDGFHPTLAGSYLAAAVMADVLFDEAPVGLPPLGLPPSRVRGLQESAAAAVQAARATVGRGDRPPRVVR